MKPSDALNDNEPARGAAQRLPEVVPSAPKSSTRMTVNLPGEIEELVRQRVEELRYPSLSAYLTGLALFDLYCRRPHWLTAELMREPQWFRDRVIAELVRDYASGERPRGWFEQRIRELAEEMASWPRPS